MTGLRTGSASGRRGGLIFKLLLGIAVCGALAAVAWVVLLPSLVVSALQSETGFRVKVDQLSANPFTATVRVAGLVVRNPEGWPEQGFVDLRRFEAEAGLGWLFSRRYEADRVVLDLAQVTLVRNREGVLNAAAFKECLAGKQGPAAAGADRGAGRRGFFIKHLELRCDRLVYADYSGRRPAVKTYDLALHRNLTDVDSVTKVVSPLTGATLDLVSGTLGSLFKGREDLLKSSPPEVRDAVGALQDAGRKTGENLRSAIESLEKKKP